MDADGLFPELPRSPRRYEVTVTVPRAGSDEDDALVPPGGQEVLQLAAAAVAAQGVLSAFTKHKTVLSMVLEAASGGDALAAGVAVARVLDSGGALAVTAEPAAAQI